MTTLKEYFVNGMTVDEYKAYMKVNKEEMQSIYDKFNLPEDSRLEEIKARNLKAIVITEDWCGDAMLNIPILLKIADKTGIDVRMVLRDEHHALIDQYLTNGTSRAIPIFVFLDEDYHQTSVWGPRAIELQRFVDESRKNLPAKDDATYEEENKKVIQTLHDTYLKEDKFWNDVYESIVSRILEL